MSLSYSLSQGASRDADTQAVTIGDQGLPDIPAPPARAAHPVTAAPSVFASPPPGQAGPQSGPAFSPPPPPRGGSSYLLSDKKKTPKWRIILLLGLLVVVIVAGLIGISLVVAGFQQSGAEANVPWTASIGECYGSDESFSVVPCSGSHSFEVFTAVVYEDHVAYPGRFERSLGNLLCDEDIEEFTGVSYFAGAYSYAEIYPSEQEWADGERWVLCALFTDSGSATSGSARSRG